MEETFNVELMLTKKGIVEKRKNSSLRHKGQRCGFWKTRKKNLSGKSLKQARGTKDENASL